MPWRSFLLRHFLLACLFVDLRCACELSVDVIRDWASEYGYARDLAERAVANNFEVSYHRTDLLQQRRPMMEAWVRHVLSS